MVEPTPTTVEKLAEPGGPKIASFEISGLFRRAHSYEIAFPKQEQKKDEPSLLILAGPNGSGKTIILQMVDGMLRLDFDIFRQYRS